MVQHTERGMEEGEKKTPGQYHATGKGEKGVTGGQDTVQRCSSQHRPNQA